MRGTRPFTDKEIEIVLQSFCGPMRIRDIALFTLGINTGFRISELLSLTLDSVLDERGIVKDRIVVWRRHMKGKRSSRDILVNEASRQALRNWLLELKQRGVIHKDDYIFYSHKDSRQPISRARAWQIIHGICKSAGMPGRIGTHSMRKTFANNIYQFFKSQLAAGKEIDPFRATSKALGHSDIRSTDQYLSFLDEEIDLAVESLGKLNQGKNVKNARKSLNPSN